MAYWWVFQNKTYEHERDGDSQWAPLRNRAGNIEAHWESMDDVRPGTPSKAPRTPESPKKPAGTKGSTSKLW